MKKRIIYSFILPLLAALFIVSCSPSESHFLKDKEYREKVHQQFLNRKELAANRSEQLFSVFDKEGLTTEKREALEFLYAYMPLSDLADYDGEFFLGQVESAFEAKEYFDWGKKIPEDVFRHFVLVYRVNNENLDTARQVFFDELKDRVKGMTMEQAVLEVNHWCHEKVTYRGTDSRTSAPLALARTSWGRCGEESTFTTVALRAVGIPARQCYTPRWVHTDDNHAWVEAWVDGEWRFIGACEPEPELDVAWFTAPAKRAMMVHTNVFGLYTGSEEKNVEEDLYSVINLLGNYTNTRQAGVKVVDEQGNAVDGATVRFKAYNYAEFYSIATTETKDGGKTSILTGLGDLFVWANKGDMYGYARTTPETNELVVTLNRKPGESYEEMLVLNPPKEQPIKELSPEKIAQNAGRLAHEDSIRNGYMSTFISEKDARDFAKANKLDASNAWTYLQKSQGNWVDVKSFMEKEKNNKILFPFLSTLTEKDLRDTPEAYLQDHIQLGGKVADTKSPFAQFVYSPQIALELVRPWRSFFEKELSADFVAKASSDASFIIEYVRENVKLDENLNYYKCPLSPQGSYEMKLADAKSRDILFVALCRYVGIPARVEKSTSRPQYMKNNKWVDVFFEKETIASPKATVSFASAKGNIVKPAYHSHYTIARYVDGDFVTLNFRSDAALNSLPGKVTVDAGYYRFMVGSRANDGSVTISTKYFEVKENETKSLDIKLPEVDGLIQVQGIVDMNSRVTLMDGSNVSLKELSNGKGILLCFSDPDKEPTKHILQDLPAVQAQLNLWGGGILFSVPDDKLSTAFDASVFKNLPKNTSWSVDANRSFLNTVAGTLQLDFSNNFPLIVYLNSNGGILFSSQGYRIGIGENIITTIEREKASLK